MKRTYPIEDLYIVKIKNKDGSNINFICEIYSESKKVGFYREVIIDDKIPQDDENIVSVERLILHTIKNTFPLISTKKDLFDIYNDLNATEVMLNCTDEIIEKELKNKGVFEKSKVYEKKKKI